MHRGQSKLQSERLYLRSFEIKDDDIATLYRWENDPESWESSLARNPVSASFIKEYVLESVGSIVSRGEMVLAIAKHEDHSLVGYLQFLDYDPISRRVGYGLYISPDQRRQGYAREAVMIAEHYAFTVLGIRLIYADVLSSNKACCQLFEQLDYQLKAVLPQWHWSHGDWHDLNYYMKWSNQ